MATQDYYETLQVPPTADGAAIEAAYRRTLDQYDPERLAGAAEELVSLARQKRAAAEQAFAVLGDQARRAAYDAGRAAGRSDGRQPAAEELPSAGDAARREPALDYRPLPPAGRAERPRGFADQPAAATGRGSRGAPRASTGMVALIVAAAVLLPSLLAGLLITGGGGIAGPPAVATPTPSPADQFETLITQARTFAEQNPNSARAWVDLGNLLYDSAQIVREQAPDSVLYTQRLPRWLDAAAAYERALAIEPENAAVRADKGASACFYGAGMGDESFLRQGLADVDAAIAQAPDDPRVLLSRGYCLAYARPPRTDEAIAGWKRISELVPADSPMIAQAQLLIERYSQP